MYTEEEKERHRQHWEATPPLQRTLWILGAFAGAAAFWGAVIHWAVPSIPLLWLLALAALGLAGFILHCLAMVIALLLQLLRPPAS